MTFLETVYLGTIDVTRSWNDKRDNLQRMGGTDSQEITTGRRSEGCPHHGHIVEVANSLTDEVIAIENCE